MPGYIKGTTVAGEIKKIRAAFHRAVVAIQASADPVEAFRDASKLGVLGQEINSGAADFRAYLAASLQSSNELTLAQLAEILGVSKARAQQLVNIGQERGNTVADPGTDPEPPAVAAAIIVSDLGVLIERRHDKIPPWTFPAGEMLPGESPFAAVTRKVPHETGLAVTPTHVIGRRIHPKTGRVMVYIAATAAGTNAVLGDPADLAEVRWATVEETRELMPDMFPPARAYLDGSAASKAS